MGALLDAVAIPEPIQGMRMRLVIDLQACQTDSRDRGIGRYAISLVEAIAADADQSDELILAIDIADVDRARDLRNELRRRQVCAKVVAYGYPATLHTDSSEANRELAGQLRCRFFASLQPDVILILSLFETGTPHTAALDWSALDAVPIAVIGYDLIPLLFPHRYLPDGFFVTDWYQARLEDLRKFDLILAISKATKQDLVAKLEIPEERITFIGAGFDKRLVCPFDGLDGRLRLHELGIVRPFVLMVGNGDWRKNTLGAVRAFASLPEPLRDAHDLVLTQVGSDVDEALETQYASLREHIHVLGKVDDATLALLYDACRIFYFPSFYEGFGLPVLEAMAFDTPVLSSSAGALQEVVRDHRALFDPESLEDGVALLTRALADERFREEIRKGAREFALTFTWQRTARAALEALRTLSGGRRLDRVPSPAIWPDVALMADACVAAGTGGDRVLETGLQAIARGGRRRALVDISEIVRLDARTGIQRVTREFFAGLAAIAEQSENFEVEPICWTTGGIHYARGYARQRLGVKCAGEDAPVSVQPSDVVFMLDSSWWSPERFDGLHACVHNAGGEVVWMIYDLIPIRFPETCDPDVLPVFKSWLMHAIRTADGFICISEATRHDLETFIDEVLDPETSRPWSRSVHLGVDSSPPADAQAPIRGSRLRTAIGNRRYMVALGTLEPRKDYPTILDAFELLWAQGVDVALVIIGKQGWNVEALVARIEKHPEFGRRLFWVQGGSDTDVRCLLERASSLIQASIWEGFGLPLIEAGSMGVPLLVSDIPVFHEVAGEGANYFQVGDANALADGIVAVAQGQCRRPNAELRLRGWGEASRELVDVLCMTSSQPE